VPKKSSQKCTYNYKGVIAHYPLGRKRLKVVIIRVMLLRSVEYVGATART